MLLSTANFRESIDPQTEYLKAEVSNEDVDVIIAAPGETVVFRAGDLDMVLTVYPERTPANEQLAIVNGQQWISRWDLESVHKLLTRRTSGDSLNLPRIYLKAAKYLDDTGFVFPEETEGSEARILGEYVSSIKSPEEADYSAEMARRAALRKAKGRKRAGNFR